MFSFIIHKQVNILCVDDFFSFLRETRSLLLMIVQKKLGIMWEKVYVGVKIEVPTDKKVSAAIEKVMNGPSADDYYAAARYYLESGKDINQAVVWMDKAIEMTKDNPRFWWLRQQSLIKAKAGDKKGAIKAAKASLEGAEKAGNADYIKMNKDSLKEWGAM